jgi:hypothetical protein
MAVALENPLDGVATKYVAKIAERVAQSRVAPADVFRGELDYERFNRLGGGWATGTAFGAAIVPKR